MRTLLRAADTRIAELDRGIQGATRDLSSTSDEAQRAALSERIRRMNGELGDRRAQREMIRVGIDETRRAEYIARNGTEPPSGPRHPGSGDGGTGGSPCRDTDGGPPCGGGSSGA